MRTYTPKPGEVERQWHIIDATDVVLGRLASQTAILLRGKHKPTFTPNVDTGDFVIIVNAEKVALTGAKLEQKRAYRHSGYPGGLKSVNYAELLETCTADQEAEGLRWSRAPARGTAAQDLRIQPGRPVIRAYEETIRRNRGSERRADRSRGRAH